MRKWRRLIRLAAVLAAVIVLLLPLSADAATETRRPNAAGDETTLTPNTGANYAAVDEVTSDEETTYVYTTNSTYLTDLYNLDDVTNVSGKGKINSVTVWIRARAVSTPVQASAYTRIKTGGTAYNGTAVTLTTAYADYSTAYPTNPQTTAEWTWLEINSLQAGVGLQRATTTGGTSTRQSRATQVWVVVDYTAATFESWKELAHTTVWGNAGTEYDGTTQTAYLYGLNYIKSHSYDVAYYDDSGVQVALVTVSSSTSNTLSSQYILTTDINAVAGTWHAVVYDNDFDSAPPGRPPNYVDRATEAGYLVEDSFDVLAAAIPEIPTVIAGIAVAGACFAIYWWMRKRRLRYVKA